MDEQELIQLVPELRGRPVAVSPLGGGLTNRNYRIDTEDGSYVLRIAGKDTVLLGIDRGCEVACSRQAAALGLGPDVISYLPEFGAMLRRFVPGRVLSANDVREPEQLRRIAEALRRYHDGPPGPGSFSAFTTVRQYYALASERNVMFPDHLARGLELLARVEQNLADGGPPRPCHNDLLAGNFIDDGIAVRIIDWEYGGMGDRFFDLGNLAANNDFDAEQERELLAGYFGDVKSDHLRRLRLMRLASDMREAMWGFVQAAISTLEVDYMAYGRQHLDRVLDSPHAAEAFHQDGAGR
jgi:thiamine kinase-like enzyme